MLGAPYSEHTELTQNKPFNWYCAILLSLPQILLAQGPELAQNTSVIIPVTEYFCENFCCRHWRLCAMTESELKRGMIKSSVPFCQFCADAQHPISSVSLISFNSIVLICEIWIIENWHAKAKIPLKVTKLTYSSLLRWKLYQFRPFQGDNSCRFAPLK